MSAPPRLRVLEALRHRDFRLLWAGQTVSQIGDAAFVVALAVAGAIYGLAGSSAIFGADAGSFLVSAAFLSFAQPRAYERAPAEGLRRELGTGFRYVSKVPWLWITIGTFSIVLMVG